MNKFCLLNKRPLPSNMNQSLSTCLPTSSHLAKISTAAALQSASAAAARTQHAQLQIALLDVPWPWPPGVVRQTSMDNHRQSATMVLMEYSILIRDLKLIEITYRELLINSESFNPQHILGILHLESCLASSSFCCRRMSASTSSRCWRRNLQASRV